MRSVYSLKTKRFVEVDYLVYKVTGAGVVAVSVTEGTKFFPVDISYWDKA